MKKQDASTGEITQETSLAESAADGTLNIKVYSPFKVYYDDKAESLTAENDTGQFDVLVGHKNFLSLLNPCDIVIRTSTGQESITIARGIIHVHNNTVTVFLDV